MACNMAIWCIVRGVHGYGARSEGAVHTVLGCSAGAAGGKMLGYSTVLVGAIADVGI